MAKQEKRSKQDEQSPSGGSARKRQSKAKKGNRTRKIESGEDQSASSSEAAVPKIGKQEVGAKNVRGEGLH